jgi:YbbR domain-containing protein
VWRTEVTIPGIHTVPVNNGIPVEVSGVPNGLIVIPQPNQSGVPQVAVQAQVPTAKESSVSSAWFRATIDLSGQKGPGTQQYPVTVVSLEPGVTPADWFPRTLPVTLDTIATRSLPIQIQYQGLPPSGYGYSTPVLDNSTNQVTITGPQTTLQQIATTIIVVRLDNRKGNFHDVAPVVPQNASGGDVSTQNLQISPKTVGYTESIQQTTTVRTVAVVPPVTGQPSEGYVVAGITVSPAQVTLVGNQSVLDNAPASIGTDAVDVSKATEDVSKTVSVQVPKNTSIVGDAHVKVTVRVTAIPASAVLVVAPQVVGAHSGTQVQFNVSSLAVTVQGAAATLQSLKPQDITTTINVAGLAAGQHAVTPTVELPPGVTASTVSPATIQVTIIPPTPTPTATPTPTRIPTATATPTPAGTPSPTAVAAAASVRPTVARVPAATPVPTPVA